jgi:hypothetical protein
MILACGFNYVLVNDSQRWNNTVICLYAIFNLIENYLRFCVYFTVENSSSQYWLWVVNPVIQR